MGSGGCFYSSCLKGEAFPVDVLLFWENLQIRPMGNVRHFRRIRKNDTLFVFLKTFVFREHLVNLCVFRGNLVNSLEHLQIIPLGNVRIFRRIRKNDTPFLKTCVFFAEFAGSRAGDPLRTPNGG